MILARVLILLPKSETMALKAEGLTTLSVSEPTDSKRPTFHIQPEDSPRFLSKVWPAWSLYGGGWPREALLQLPSGSSWQEDFRAKGHRLN